MLTGQRLKFPLKCKIYYSSLSPVEERLSDLILHFILETVNVGKFGLREAMRHALLLFISDSLKQSNK